MKIVALMASPRRGGNTEKMVRMVEGQLCRFTEAAGIPLDFEMIALADLNLALCRGCRVCFDRGEAKCPLKDDLGTLYEKLRGADGAIVASPVFVEDVTAIMKNFIDRMAFNCHRPAFAGKTSLILTTSGSGSSNHIVRTLQYALGSWGFHIAGHCKFRMGALMDEAAARGKYGAAAEAAALKLFTAVKEQKALTPAFFSLMMFKIQQTIYRESPVFRDTDDRDWWESGGRLDKKSTFLSPTVQIPLRSRQPARSVPSWRKYSDNTITATKKRPQPLFSFYKSQLFTEVPARPQARAASCPGG